jgi:hypothetical protein
MGDTNLEKTMLMFPQERKLVFFLESCFRSVPFNDFIFEVSIRKSLEVIILNSCFTRY